VLVLVLVPRDSFVRLGLRADFQHPPIGTSGQLRATRHGGAWQMTAALELIGRLAFCAKQVRLIPR
jgi:hypothetical protein